MALTVEDLKKIREIFKEERADLATKEELDERIAKLATKEELDKRIANLATKEELDEKVANLATKEDLKSYVTKDYFKDWEEVFWERLASVFGNLVTKEEFYAFKTNVDEMKNQLIVIQDVVLAINNKLDTEYKFIVKRGERNTKRIEKLENFVGIYK